VFLKDFGESSSTLASAKFVISKKAAISSRHDACIPRITSDVKQNVPRHNVEKEEKFEKSEPPVKNKASTNRRQIPLF